METKICSSCKQELSLPDFPFIIQRKKRSAKCKTCKQEYDRKYWKLTKERRNERKRKTISELRNSKSRFVYEYLLEHPCETCGEKDPIVLEFDHVNPSTKEFNIAEMANKGFSLEKIKEEISKCRVLCANCHRRHTAKQFNYFSYKFSQTSGYS
jgi:hypothetical protein